jgi:hypothetical protein
MGTINFNGPVKITGANAHVGDNYFGTSPAAFYQATSNIQYSDTEKQLVDLIYENTKTDAERTEILNSLKNVKETGETKGHEESNKQNASKIKHFLTAVGTDTAAKIIVELGAHLLKGMH